MTPAVRDFVRLIAAGILLLSCLARPTVPLERDTFRYLFVLDITQSMNARDYHEDDLPRDRLSFGKLALREAIRELPCGSEAGIGLFSTKDVLLLIEPLEICAHFAAIDDALAHIDWRMAWSADSNIERGLYGSLLAARNLTPGMHLVFMSDGGQNVRELHRPPLAGLSGKIQGYIIGLGGFTPAPIPKLDQDHRLTGFWTNAEVDEFLIDPEGLKPASQKSPDPDAPYGSTLNETNLQTLAAISGLRYHRLETPQQFVRILQTEEFSETRTVETDIRWLFALVSLALVLMVYRVPLNSPKRR